MRGRLLKKAFGEENGKDLAQKATQLQSSGAGKLDWLRNADPQQVAAVLEKEHPQTIALVLFRIWIRSMRHQFFRSSPNELQIDVVKRIAQLRHVLARDDRQDRQAF